jgi:hypothetical protein
LFAHDHLRSCTHTFDLAPAGRTRFALGPSPLLSLYLSASDLVPERSFACFFLSAHVESALRPNCSRSLESIRMHVEATSFACLVELDGRLAKEVLISACVSAGVTPFASRRTYTCFKATMLICAGAITQTRELEPKPDDFSASRRQISKRSVLGMLTSSTFLRWRMSSFAGQC